MKEGYCLTFVVNWRLKQDFSPRGHPPPLAPASGPGSQRKSFPRMAKTGCSPSLILAWESLKCNRCVGGGNTLFPSSHIVSFWVLQLSFSQTKVGCPLSKIPPIQPENLPYCDFTFMHWRRKWQATPVFLPGESQGRGSLVGSHRVGQDWSDLAAAAGSSDSSIFLLKAQELKHCGTCVLTYIQINEKNGNAKIW